jgi:hypothetical protein
VSIIIIIIIIIKIKLSTEMQNKFDESKYHCEFERWNTFISNDHILYHYLMKPKSKLIQKLTILGDSKKVILIITPRL